MSKIIKHSVVYGPIFVKIWFKADFSAELPLYLKTDALLNHLKEWVVRVQNQSINCFDVPSCLENLYIALYERDFIGLKDVHLVQKWIEVLQGIGYEFPKIQMTNLKEQKLEDHEIQWKFVTDTGQIVGLNFDNSSYFVQGAFIRKQ